MESLTYHFPVWKSAEFIKAWNAAFFPVFQG
jgi:hypothetical protein